MIAADSRLRYRSLLWLLLIGLLTLRIPSFVEPTGNDQNLYLYIGDRARGGDVPYVDAWDHKPPGIYVLYGALRAVWPHASVVALADTIAAGLTALALVALGRRMVGEGVGFLSAGLFLLLGHPSLTRLGGIYVRGQCEVFIALAVTVGLLLLWRRSRRAWHLVTAGVCFGCAVWLKYNALAYGLPAIAALMVVGVENRRWWRDGLLVGLGAATVSALVLGYFASHGAVDALRLATLDYNLRYSGETYDGGPVGVMAHIVGMVVGEGGRVRADFLWYLGFAGAALLAVSGVARAVVATLWAWIAAAILSIAVNSARDLPQYFVLAAPVLALTAAVGLGQAFRRGRLWATVAALVVMLGLWKVGVDAPAFGVVRLAGLPGLWANVSFDADYMQGRIPRETYLARFTGAQKYPAAAIDRLADHVRRSTATSDRIFIFGFAPGVYVEGQRQSASRFFWSRPVIIGFESGRPTYGAAGLLLDLETGRPALVALQKQDWAPDVTNSAEYFLTTPILRDWLYRDYELESDTPFFSVWRRRTP